MKLLTAFVTAFVLLTAPLFAQSYDLELAVVCDDSFFAEYGDDSHDRVADLFAIVAPLFDFHFNVTIHLNTVIQSEDFDTPVDFSSTGPVLLQSFRTYMQNNWSAIYPYDFAILLHNETFTPGGQASQPGVCAPAFNRYGYARDLPNNLELTAALIAHELGHALNASHDTTFPPGGGSTKPYATFTTPAGPSVGTSTTNTNPSHAKSSYQNRRPACHATAINTSARHGAIANATKHAPPRRLSTHPPTHTNSQLATTPERTNARSVTDTTSPHNPPAHTRARMFSLG